MLPLTDPAFYAFAVPAVLLIGLAKSGFLSGFGSLATPMLALVLPVPQAAAIMLPLLLVADAFGLKALWRERDRRLLRQLLPWGLAGLALGGLGFSWIPPRALAALVGAITLLYLLHRVLVRRRAQVPAAASAWAGPACGAAAGFTSFILHAGAPPLQAYLLPMRLAPIALSATSGVFFAVMNSAKVLPYAAMGLWDWRGLATSLVLLPLAPLGVWLGLWLTRRVSAELFYRIGYAGMGATGLKLLWDGLHGS